MNWPNNVWTILLQCVLPGKARDVYSSLSLSDSSDYDVVKAAVLRAYELVPEAYLQRFRGCSKQDKQTFVEFAKEKENLFDWWCTSLGVNTKEQLRDLIILEEFKKLLPSTLTNRVTSIADAAVYADELF